MAHLVVGSYAHYESVVAEHFLPAIASNPNFAHLRPFCLMIPNPEQARLYSIGVKTRWRRNEEFDVILPHDVCFHIPCIGNPGPNAHDFPYCRGGFPVPPLATDIIHSACFECHVDVQFPAEKGADDMFGAQIHKDGVDAIMVVPYCDLCKAAAVKGNVECKKV